MRMTNLAAHSRNATSIAFAMILSLATLAVAQRASMPATTYQYSERVNARSRDECAQIIAAIPQRLAHERVPPAVGNMGDIVHCDEHAPPVLAAAWRTVPFDTAAIGFLIWASSTLRDRRLEEVLTEMLLDSIRPSPVRQAAAAVLAHYAYPTLGGRIAERFWPPDTLAVSIPMAGHPLLYEGAEPVDAGIRERVIALFKSIPRTQNRKRLGELLSYLTMMLESRPP
jgi:hypothetical protein